MSSDCCPCLPKSQIHSCTVCVSVLNSFDHMNKHGNNFKLHNDCCQWCLSEQLQPQEMYRLKWIGARVRESMLVCEIFGILFPHFRTMPF